MISPQFRVLFRHFLFRIVDLELLSPQGDISRLLGQFAAVLLMVGLLFSIRLMGVDERLPHQALLISVWGLEHSMIATTMLVVGIFAVLSWDSAFLELRDVLVLTPMPVRARTMFFAKACALAVALSIAVAAFNVVAGIAMPLALAPDARTTLELLFSPARYRMLAAYWVTVASAGAFLFGCILAIQGLAAQLPRRVFLRLSPILQMASFCLFVGMYFLQPSLATPAALGAPENQGMLAWLPSYWFLGLFQQLNGSMHETMEPLARRAWIGLLVAGVGTSIAYAASYFRTLKRIAEEPDIVRHSRSLVSFPQLSGALTTALLNFSARTLLRSRQHRVMMAFYLGLGFAVMVLFLGTPGARKQISANYVPLIFSSLLMMVVCVGGLRVVFAMPFALRANWIFRMTEVRTARGYLTAMRRPLFVLGVLPVWLVSALYFLSNWNWQLAAGHLVILGLWGTLLAWVCLHGFQKVPFTCSWLPGKSTVHMAVLGALGFMMLLIKGAAYEWMALQNLDIFVRTVIVVASGVAAAAAWTLIDTRAEAIVQFEEEEPPVIVSLGLHKDGVLLT